MAVNKMKKMTIISDRNKEEAILQRLQGLQSIEIKQIREGDLPDSYLEKEWNLDAIEANHKKQNQLLLDIQESLLIMERHVENYSKKNQLKRSTVTLESLEKQYEEEKISQYIAHILEIKKKIDEIQESRIQLEEQKQAIIRWQRLDVLPNQYENFNYTAMLLGSINLMNQSRFLEELKKLENVYVEELYTSPHHAYYAFIYLKIYEKDMQNLMTQNGVHLFDYPFEELPQKAIKQMELQSRELLEEEYKTRKQFAKCKEWVAELCLAEEVLRAYSQRDIAKKELLRSKQFFVLQGWIPQGEEVHLEQVLAENFAPDEVLIQYEEPTPEEIKNNIPTQLNNHSLIEPFEILTEMYSLPKYDEIDPTPIMMPFYLILFGMMVADLGYGLVLLVFTTLVRYLMILPRAQERFVRFLQLLSFPIMIWGIIYGTFFGMEIPPDSIWLMSVSFPLLSPSTDVNQILILSVVFGFIQIMTGLMVNGIQLIKRKQYLSSIGDGFAWQALLIGFVVIGAGSLFLKQQAFVTVGIVIVILAALSIIMVPVIQNKSKVKGLARGMYSLYGVTGYIGDLVSYTRLMALGISGGSIAAAFNMIVGYMPPLARFTFGIVLLIILH